MIGGRARRRDLRLAPIALSIWATAWAAVTWPHAAGAIATSAWVIAGCALGFAVRRYGGRAKRAAAVLAAAAAVSAACAGHVALAQVQRGEVAAWDIGGGRGLVAELVATGKVEPTVSGWRFDAVLESVQWGSERRQAGVPVLVRLTERPEGLDLGARLRLAVTSRPAENGRREVLVLRGSGDARVHTPAAGVLGVASALRSGLVRLTETLPPPAAGLIAGLAVGDTSRVTPELDQAMKTSSLSHLTAVSGANCALVVGVAFGIAALCAAPRVVRVAAGLAALAGFVVLVSPEPSVVRAAGMATIAMLGILLGRPGAGISVLTAAVVVLLLADPWLATSLGFALSAAATGSLLLAAGPLADGLSRWIPSPLALAISVPLAAQLACGPLLILISAQIPVFGVLANLLCAPAAPAGTLLGLAACLLAGIPVLGPGLAALAWLPAAWIAGSARLFADSPLSTVPWAEGLVGAVALAVVSAALLVVIVRAAGRVRTGGLAVLIGALVIGAATGPVAGIVSRATVPSAWTIAACDVGQGDAILVRSERQIALVDTGPDPEELRACLDLFGVDRIDLLVLTHFDLDHRGGLEAVSDRVDVVLHGPVPDAGADETLGVLRDRGATVQEVSVGATGRLGDARWRVLWPRTSTPPGNSASVTLEISGGGVPPLLLLGDLTADAQRQLRAASRLASAYAVIKVAHHGSADQDTGLYERASAAVGLISVGENTYGHPRAEILTVIEDAGGRVVRTDESGAVALWQTGEALRLWTQRRPVAPAG